MVEGLWLKGEGFADHFVIVEMMLDALDILIVFMAFSGDEDDVARLCHHASGSDGLAAIHNADDLTHVLGREACEHIVDLSLIHI